jgi:DNA-binding transcriptional ArsR family regulator
MHTIHRFMLRGRMLAAGVAVLGLAAAGCAGTSSGRSVSGAVVAGGTAVLAEPPSTTPNYIWPFAPSADFSDINTWNLQNLMYRPLYWFGQNGQPTVNNTLSVANPPVFNGSKVTITLKHYMWSNGTAVTAQDVVFWLNMETAEPGTAAVRGAMTALLNSLHPRLSYHNGTFAFSYPCNGYITLCPVGPRRLALLPMIAGRDMVLFSFEHPDVCWIGYPLPQPRPGARATEGSALATVLGPVRAAILQALRQSLTVSDLAAAVHCAPTTATYHLHQLAAAGLITREKSGSAVWVSRTTRANDLADLLAD